MLKHKTHFEGRVQSLGFIGADGRRRSLGVVQEGQYNLEIHEREQTHVISGALQVRRVGEERWTPCHAGQSFSARSGEQLELRAEEITAYCCEYYGA